ncbi:MAG: hypothetical protein BWY42_00610 [Candidatus Omnitrophica bacterium ADurb.Bin277]|nr:MAG: hypothetical protein BWY42_00610 [Candidatus Omnitrophica bacterium ADurb.Bin277]
MILHLGYELPVESPKTMAEDQERFTPEEVRIVKRQIRRNLEMIDAYIKKVDLFVNQERYPHREEFIEKLRKRLFLLMEENDTFRKVLWKHFQQETVGVVRT